MLFLIFWTFWGVAALLMQTKSGIHATLFTAQLHKKSDAKKGRSCPSVINYTFF
jgi:hypothetical protein